MLQASEHPKKVQKPTVPCIGSVTSAPPQKSQSYFKHLTQGAAKLQDIPTDILVQNLPATLHISLVLVAHLTAASEGQSSTCRDEGGPVGPAHRSLQLLSPVAPSSTLPWPLAPRSTGSRF